MYREKKLKYWGRKQKYNAKRTECLTGHWHNSGLEGRVCDELRLRKIAGEIEDYEIEKTFRLELEGVKLGSYRADFVVTKEDGRTEVIEAKGLILPGFRQKWAIIQKMYPDYEFSLIRK